MIDGNLNIGINAVGQVGVWRLINSDYDLSDVTIMNQISDLESPFQPEYENFIVVEICNG